MDAVDTDQRIMTVRGPIAPSELGTCTMHDHVLSIMDPFFRSRVNEEELAALPIDVTKMIALEDLFYLNQLRHLLCV